MLSSSLSCLIFILSVYFFRNSQPKILLIAGPRNVGGHDQSDTKSSNQKQDNAIPVLIGHHTVPPASKTQISPAFFITHLKSGDELQTKPTEKHKSDLHSAAKDDRSKAKNVIGQKHLAKLFEAVRNNQSFFYTVIASVGIPLALLLIFYFEVRSYLYGTRALPFIPAASDARVSTEPLYRTLLFSL